MNSNVSVIGAGAWGTAIANLVAKNNHPTLVLTNEAEAVSEINNSQTNLKYLPDITLSANLKAGHNITEADLCDRDFIFIVTPSQTVKAILLQISHYKLKDNVGFVICSKGLDQENLEFFSETFLRIMPNRKFAILSGPNFAIEVAQEVPTVTNISSVDAAFAKSVINLLKNDYFLPQYHNDPITIEIAAVVKNVMAIGCGIVDGLQLGQNAKAAVLDRGVQEILLLCKKLSGTGDLNNPAGFGDIFLTCSTTKSRNNSLGFEIAQGKTYAQISSNPYKTYEGATSVKSINKLASKLGLKLVLCQVIEEILDNSFAIDEIRHKITQAILTSY